MAPLRGLALLATLAAWRLASTDAAGSPSQPTVGQKRLQAEAVGQGAKVQRVDESTDLRDYWIDSMSDGSDESADLGDYIESMSHGPMCVVSFASLFEPVSPNSVYLVPGTIDVTSPVLDSTSSQPHPQQEQEQQPLPGRHPDTVR